MRGREAQVPDLAAPLHALRARRDAVRGRLDELDALVGALLREGEADARAGRVSRIVSLLEDELRPYMEWEGRILHPLIDRFACEGPMAFSASMQHEHLVVDRWIGELAAAARDTRADPQTFARRADRLLGLLVAHFEVEDRVFLPVLDRAIPARH